MKTTEFDLNLVVFGLFSKILEERRNVQCFRRENHLQFISLFILKYIIINFFLEISVRNDLALHDIIMKKTDNSMAKLQKYENLAEKLIEGNIEGEQEDHLKITGGVSLNGNNCNKHLK